MHIIDIIHFYLFTPDTISLLSPPHPSLHLQILPPKATMTIAFQCFSEAKFKSDKSLSPTLDQITMRGYLENL